MGKPHSAPSTKDAPQQAGSPSSFVTGLASTPIRSPAPERITNDDITIYGKRDGTITLVQVCIASAASAADFSENAAITATAARTTDMYIVRENFIISPYLNVFNCPDQPADK
jgi:hypothetical protein